MTKSSKKIFSTIGASNHSDYKRPKNDYYATDSIAITLLHKHNLLDKDIPYWETAVGGGSLSNELKRLGYNVTKETDLFDRGCGVSGVDFLKETEMFYGNTITNPPYSLINDWIVKSLEITSNKVYIFGRIQTLETISRYDRIYKNNPPTWVCPFVKRIKCYIDGTIKKYNSAVCYAWFIWDNNDNNNECKIKWLI